jgi:hypothetical protein
VVIATPNRWHPLELHSKQPLLHWLLSWLYWHLLKLIGFGFFADEQNLNLLGWRDLQRTMDAAASGTESSCAEWRLFACSAWSQT